jgi:replication factor C subunit 3/5
MDVNFDEKDELQLKFQQETLPWIEKYRPEVLDQIISHDEIINTLQVFIKNKCVPHLLFYGPPGSGKTSTIMAAAKQLYGKFFNHMVMELNASDDRGIDVVRNRIKRFVISKNVYFRDKDNDMGFNDNIFKLVILDETDAMTSDAQAILRKIVEEYTHNTRFCLVCNYIQNISPALQSRCTRFRFSPISVDNIKKKINEITGKENINITKQAIDVIALRSRGDMRKVLNILQSVSMTCKIISEKNVNICVGYPRKGEMEIIIRNLIGVEYKECYLEIVRIKNDNGLALTDIITEIHDILIEYVIEGESDYEDVRGLEDSRIIGILNKLRDIEFNNSVNACENVQIGGLVGIFKV